MSSLNVSEQHHIEKILDMGDGFYSPPTGADVRADAGRRYPLYGSNVLEYV